MSYVATMMETGFSFQQDGYIRRYSIPYQVMSDTPKDVNFLGATAALNAPTLGTPYAFDPGAFFDRLEFKGIDFAADGTTVFKFSAEYGPWDQKMNPNPLNAPPEMSFSTKQYSVVMASAYGGGDAQFNPTTPILNTSKMPYDPPPMRIKRNTVIHVSYNTLKFEGSWKVALEGTLNKTAFTVAESNVPAGFAMLNEIGAQVQFDPKGNKYWRLTLQIEIDSEDGWAYKLLSNGYECATPGGISSIYVWTDASAGEFTQNELYPRYKILYSDILAGKASPISTPCRLSEAGGIVQPAAPATDSYWQTFSPYFTADWSPLAIPRSALGSVGGGLTL
jgi:hypothetical protein